MVPPLHFTAVAAAVALTACVSSRDPEPAQQPAEHAAAAALNRRALAQAKRLQWAEAAPLFREAAEANAAHGDHLGALQSWLNEAVAAREAADADGVANALAQIDAYWTEVEPTRPDLREDADVRESLAEASWVRALVAADRRATSAAREAAARARAWNPESAAFRARLAAFEARLLVTESRWTAAAAASRAAAAANLENDQPREAANALRYLGESALALGDPPAALEAYQHALRLDENRAPAHDLIGDLQGIATAAGQLGRGDLQWAATRRIARLEGN